MTDPLYRAVPVDHEVLIPVLGVPTRFMASDAEILGAVEETFGAWRRLEGREDLWSGAQVTVRIWMHAGDEGPLEHAPISYRAPDPELVLVSTPGSFGVADAGKRSAVGYVTRAFLADRAHFCEGFLKSLTLSIVARDDRQAFHAAAVAHGDAALLLYGPSGVGKSTLAWACAERGLRVLADDAVYLQMNPTLRVWGSTGPVRVPEDSRCFFSALGDDLQTFVAGGRTKLAVPRPPLGGGALPVAERAGICILEPSSGAPALEPMAAEEIVERAAHPIEPGFDWYADTIGPAVERLAAAGGWRLRLGSDPHAAAALVSEALAEL